MKRIAIIGYGRFGALLAKLAGEIFDVAVVESNPDKAARAQAAGIPVIPLALIGKADFIFIAVPISAFEAAIQAIADLVQPSQVVIDLCSVKVYPAAVMQKYLTIPQLLGSHPMFGPDSAKKGLDGMQVALCPLRITPDNLKIVQSFWAGLGCETIETSPDAHDKDTAYSQAFTYSIARLINETKLPDITFKTRSFVDITEVARLSAKDTPQLFHDMLFYNPYFLDMKDKLTAAMTETSATLDEIAEQQLRIRHLL